MPQVREMSHAIEFEVGEDTGISVEQTHDDDEWYVEIGDENCVLKLCGDGKALTDLLEDMLTKLRAERTKLPMAVVCAMADDKLGCDSDQLRPFVLHLQHSAN